MIGMLDIKEVRCRHWFSLLLLIISYELGQPVCGVLLVLLMPMIRFLVHTADRQVVHIYLCVMETDRVSQLLNRPSMLMRTSGIHYDYELSVTAVSQFNEWEADDLEMKAA